MDESVLRARAFREAYVKLATELTADARSHLAPKNFALSAKQSDTGKPAYPIEDKQHARSALGFVGMHGSPSEKSEVYKDVARKFPDLAAKSSVPALRSKEKDSNMGQNGMQGLPGVVDNMKMGGLMNYMSNGAGEHKTEIAGLGVLAAPAVDRMQAVARARLSGEKGEAAVHKRQLMGETGHALTELGGLGMLTGPSIAHLRALAQKGHP